MIKNNITIQIKNTRTIQNSITIRNTIAKKRNDNQNHFFFTIKIINITKTSKLTRKQTQTNFSLF